MKVFLSHSFWKDNQGDVTVLKSILNELEKIPYVQVDFEYVKPKETILKRYWLKFTRFVKADIILFATRDDLSLTYCFPLTVLYEFFLAIILRKPSMLFAAQIGPFGNGFKGKLASSLVALFLNRINLITVRDRISKQELIRLGVTKTPVYLTADLGFILEPIDAKGAEILLSRCGVSRKKEKILGINISALAYHYAFPRIESLDKKRIMYVDLFGRLIDRVIEELGVTVVLVPSVSDDRIIEREIYERVSCKDRVYLITKQLEPEELKGIIGLFEMFITSRFHPLVHSTSMLVPTIAIDYTFKMKNLMEELNCSNYLCHVKDIDFEKLASKTNQLWSIRKEVRKNMDARIGDIKKRSELNVELVKDFMRLYYGD